MHIFIGADHGGFDLKNDLIEYLQEKNIRVEDMGAYELDPVDDFPDYAQKVAQAVLQNPAEFKGIIVCRSGGGVCMAANRYKGIRASVGYSEEQVSHDRADDDVNILCIGGDFSNTDQAKKLVDVFLSTPAKTMEKYVRRRLKLDTI